MTVGSRPIVYFRADGHAKMGLGHVFRSLALAEMLRDHFSCHFMIREPLPSLHKQILAICESITALPITENHDQEAQYLCDTMLKGNEIVVLDGYHFRTSYQQAIREKGCKVVCIDDIHACHFVADVIINHAAGIMESDYDTENYTCFYLGLKYALLRKPFRENARNHDFKDREAAILICMGGADPNNDTLKVLEKCAIFDENFQYYIVTGPAYLYEKELRKFIQDTNLKINWLVDVSAEEMLHCMRKCPVAILPPSTVAYEYLSVGGVLYLRITADNQIRMNESFITEELAFSFDDFGENIRKEDHLPQLLDRQARFFDGRQQQRFINIFTNLVTSKTIC